MIHYHKPECPLKKRITASKVKVTAKGQNVNVCPDDIFSTKHLVTKFGIVMHHPEIECMQKDCFAIFKVKITARAHNYDENKTVSTISSELLILLPQIGLIEHFHKPESFMEKLVCCVQDQGQQNFKMLMNLSR